MAKNAKIGVSQNQPITSKWCKFLIWGKIECKLIDSDENLQIFDHNYEQIQNRSFFLAPM